MSLETCSNIDGEQTIVSSDPAVEVFSDVTFVPFTQGYYTDIDPNWGIFDANGDLIPSTTYNRRANRERIGLATRCTPLARAADATNQTYIYGGPMIHHYGHFITATLPRFWYAFREQEKNAKVLIHSLRPIKDLFNLPYFAGIMHGLGLSEEHLVTFAEPTAIKTLIVPTPSFEEQNFAHDVFGQMCRSIGAKSPTASMMNDKPIYLSKNSLAGGVCKMTDEPKLLAVFEQAGFDIAHPNLMRFDEQVEMMRTRRIVIGSGSAHHTSIFSDQTNYFISLVPANVIVSNFLLLDHLSGYCTYHVQPEGGCRTHTDLDQRATFDTILNDTRPEQFDAGRARDLSQKTSGFLSLSTIPDPLGFAKDIVNLASRRRPF